MMREILESGKLVQKMAAFHGTGGTEKSFNGYGTYVVSVNEGDAKQIGMKRRVKNTATPLCQRPF